MGVVLAHPEGGTQIPPTVRTHGSESVDSDREAEYSPMRAG